MTTSTLDHLSMIIDYAKVTFRELLVLYYSDIHNNILKSHIKLFSILKYVYH